jgi:HK97 family phage prohead protease
MTKLQRKDDVFRGDLGPVIEIKAVSDTGIFEGYASTFGNVDLGGDVVVPGAYLDSLIARPAAKVKLLWQHSPYDVIGKFLEIKEDAAGLYVQGQLNLKVQKGAEAYALLQDGAIDGLSIGYRTMADEIDRALGVRKILKCDLYEVSLVTFPMNEGGKISRVKSGALPTIREFEDILKRDVGLSLEQAKAVIATGYKSLVAGRDVRTQEQASAVDELNKLAEVFRS